MIAFLQRLALGALRKWLVLTVIGIAWMIVGPTIVLVIPMPYSLYAAFTIWIWMLGHTIIIVRDGMREAKDGSNTTGALER